MKNIYAYSSNFLVDSSSDTPTKELINGIYIDGGFLSNLLFFTYVKVCGSLVSAVAYKCSVLPDSNHSKRKRRWRIWKQKKL